MTRPGSHLRGALAFALAPLTAMAALALWPDAGEAQPAGEEHAALFPVCKGAATTRARVQLGGCWRQMRHSIETKLSPRTPPSTAGTRPRG